MWPCSICSIYVQVAAVKGIRTMYSLLGCIHHHRVQVCYFRCDWSAQRYLLAKYIYGAIYMRCNNNHLPGSRQTFPAKLTELAGTFSWRQSWLIKVRALVVAAVFLLPVRRLLLLRCRSVASLLLLLPLAAPLLAVGLSTAVAAIRQRCHCFHGQKAANHYHLSRCISVAQHSSSAPCCLWWLWLSDYARRGGPLP